ncbi:MULTISPECIES: non-ribosomal peptide synthetase [Methylomonas]|uniref:Non-ribosomal peptide synthetase n=1 Tax=Methylomonas koyamae TaxID=702114 RepID=A0A177P5V7_9GAMM|nr:non-ribosomal peptide synthetase [Methylomonas koyamae]OAI25591.1 non-ribosomal peptide synthetase [Methylomonas koyamae]
MLNERHYFDGSANDVLRVEGATSLTDVLQRRTECHPHRIAYTFLDYGASGQHSLTYGELNAKSRQLAALLQQMGLQGERALLLYPPGLDYIVAFFACLCAGAIAVPAYPPSNNRHMPRLQAILDDSKAKIILTTQQVAKNIRHFPGATGNFLDKHWLQTDVVEHNVDASSWQAPILQAKDLAFLQYTSGSTGDAKGVMISHGNLMANQQLIKRRFGHDERSTVVGWLPLYHDMGLIGNVMQPLYCGASAVLMSPMAFLEKPLRWLQAISDYRAHTSGGPNFAYDLCVQKISRDELMGIDLSSWQLAFNGAEPINPLTLQRFSDAFKACGFQRRAFYPCYGLAEATLLATGIAKQSHPRIAAFNKTALEQGVVDLIDENQLNARSLVGCGTIDIHDGQDLRIVDPDNAISCPNGRIGEIWLSGPCIARGYWQNPDVSGKTFVYDAHGQPWLRTGDLGFIDGGELFVSGRLKDLIIIRGRNYYPHDLEYAVEAATDALNPASTVTFSVDEGDGEKLIVLAELKRNRVRQGDYRSEFSAIRARLTEECGIQADQILFLKPGAILKTSSGKLRRNACRELFIQHGFEFIAIDNLQVTSEISQSLVSVDSGASERRLLRQALLAIDSGNAADLLAGHLALKASALSGLAAGTVETNHTLPQLGLDSLKAVEMKYFIDELLGIDLPITDLLGSSTLSACAVTALNQAKHAANLPVSLANVGIEKASNSAMSYNQQALWTRAQIGPNNASHHMFIALQIRDELNREALGRALIELHQRHSQLRVGFKLGTDQHPVCLPRDRLEPWLEQVDCRDHSQQMKNLHSFFNKPFDLEHGPLLRCRVFSCDDDYPVLAFCAHHLIVDFRSLQVLLTELQTLYLAQSAGQTSLLPSSKSVYSDYVAWQRNYLDSAAAEQDLNYWRRQLAGELPRVELPGERLSAGADSYQSSAETLHISTETLNKLKCLAAIHHTTLYTLLLSVFKTLLYRYSGQTDLIVGSPTLGRPKREFADLVGYFVNPVALRSRPHGEQPFCDYLAHVSTTVLEALDHQHYPYALLVEKVLHRTANDIAPFRTWFVLQSADDPLAAALALGQSSIAGQWGDVAVATVALPERSEEFDLALLCAEIDQGLKVVFSYRCDVMSRLTALRMLGHFQCLLNGILAEPTARLSQLPFLTVPEKQQLAAWNSTTTCYPEHPSIVDLFEAAVDRQPQATALIFGEQRISYVELNQRANRLAHYLIAQGAGPERRIALSMPRCSALLIGMLAILKAGAVYVPVDPSYPQERQTYLFQDAGADWLLTVMSLAPALDSGHLVKICVDQPHEFSAYSAANPSLIRFPTSAAYLIYTSGSTGHPKGVVVSHANLLHSTLARSAYYREPLDCYLLLPSFAFDSSVAGIFWSLSQGAALCLPDDNLLKEPLGLGALIEHNQVTHLLTLPSLYQLLLEHVPSVALQSLRTAIVAGEACPGVLTELHHTRLPNVELFNEYGPTEATVWCSVYRVQPTDCDATLPIGTPIANMRIHIVDAAMQPVPVGVAGELLVGGEGISRGYIGQPGLTAERFVPDPFVHDGGRLYRTGDRVRYRADGNIEFLGRFDQQVKIRGYRIELGEIEACLLRHPGVNAAAVIVREDAPGMKRLVAYWSGDASVQDGLKSLLKDGLPDYMQPSAWVWLESMPLNANGKLDRKALPMPEIRTDDQDTFVAPRDEAEEAVASIWREVLGIDRLSIHDDFFELGGHSLAGVQVMAKIQEMFAIDLPVNVLFEATTLAKFVDRMAECQSEE